MIIFRVGFICFNVTATIFPKTSSSAYVRSFGLSLKFPYFCQRQPFFQWSISDALVWVRPNRLSPHCYLKQFPCFLKIIIAYTISKLTETFHLGHNHSSLSYFVGYNVVRIGLGDQSIFFDSHVIFLH